MFTAVMGLWEEALLNLGISIPTSRLDLFIRSVEIASYLPGRVRLYSKKLVGSPALAGEVEAHLGSFPEISGVETSTDTGSILIRYVPDTLRRNPELRRVEEYIMTHARRRN